MTKASDKPVSRDGSASWGATPAHPPRARDDTLSNPDLAPVPLDQRRWSTWNIAALWIGMAVCIPTYMIAAGMISLGMSWWQAMLTMILNGHGGTKYGVPFPVLIRSAFGTSGAHVPAVARGLVACGWFGIQSWIGGWAIYIAIGALDWIDVKADLATNIVPFLGITPWQFGCFLLFWGINVAIVVMGVNSIKILETWAAPFLLACGVALLVWALTAVENTADLFSQKSQFDSPGQFWKVFFPQLTAMVGFWATLSLNIPDFTRYCRTQRDQALGQVIGLPTTMTLFCFIGIVVTAATVVVFGEAIWDPVVLVSKLGSPTVVVVSMIALTIATLSTNLAANVVSPANGFSNVAPRLISFRTGALITCAIGVLIMPWRLYNDLGAYIFTWLIGYSALLGPIAGVMIADYFILRRTRLDPGALYDPRGPYRGINHAAMLAMTIAVLPNIPGFLFAASNGKWSILPEPAQSFFNGLYSYAWFVGLVIAGALYIALAFRKAKPAPEQASTS